MTTLEERRAWFRAGMPVSDGLDGKPLDVEPRVRVWCGVFEVAVVRNIGRLAIYCKGCGDVTECGSMSLGAAASLPEIPVIGATGAVNKACHHMARHAEESGMPEPDARLIFEGKPIDGGSRSVSDHASKMLTWAKALMRLEDGDDSKGGYVGKREGAIFLREVPHGKGAI